VSRRKHFCCFGRISVILLLGVGLVCLAPGLLDFQPFDTRGHKCEINGTDGVGRDFYTVYLDRCISTIQHDGSVVMECHLRFTAGESSAVQLPDTDVQLRITTESGRRSLKLTLNSAESLPFRDTLMFVLPPDWQTFDLQFYVSGGRSPYSVLRIFRDGISENGTCCCGDLLF